MAVAASLVITVPANSLLSMSAAKRYAGFTWLELAVALRKSAMVSLISALGPIAAISCTVQFGDPSIKVAAIAALLSGAAWALGLRLLRHPLLLEILRAREALRSRLARARLRFVFSPGPKGVELEPDPSQARKVVEFANSGEKPRPPGPKRAGRNERGCRHAIRPCWRETAPPASRWPRTGSPSALASSQ